jgi:hypothetical protein
VDLEQRLASYEVTAVPAHSLRTRLRLIWSAPAGPQEPEGDAATDPPDARSKLAILADYRITRVPSRAAS